MYRNYIRQSSINYHPAFLLKKQLCFLLFLVLNATMMTAQSVPDQDSLQRHFTVAKVYPEKYSDPGTVQVTFYESARFYKIEKSNPQCKAIVAILKEAIKKKKRVLVTLNNPEGNIIQQVE